MPDMHPIYSGNPEDFTWAGFGSGSGTNLRECAKVRAPALVFSDRPKAKLLQLEELAAVPKEALDGFGICGSWQAAKGNPKQEAAYWSRATGFNEQVLNILQRHEERIGRGIDLIVLGGYMRFVLDPLLSAYQDRIINVHPADTSILSYGKRRFVGGDAVYDAIRAGQRTTRSSVIIVDKQEDHGENLVQGPEVGVWLEYLRGTPEERREAERKYADAHQGLQKVRSDWPALTTALRFIADGRLALGTTLDHAGEWRTVFLDGQPLGDAGFQIARGAEAGK